MLSDQIHQGIEDFGRERAATPNRLRLGTPFGVRQKRRTIMKKIAIFGFFAAVLIQGAVAQTESLPAMSAPGAVKPTTQALASRSFSISYVKSDRKWRFGFRSEPYNKMSEFFQNQLVEALQLKGIRQVPKPDGSSCCVISLELLEVATRPAMIKKPGMAVSATVTILDANQRPIYSKGFRGESKTLMNTYGHLINHAIEAMVENIVGDQNVINALVEGKL
jgi:hypothetical protein